MISYQWQVERYVSRLGPEGRVFAEQLVAWYRIQRYGSETDSARTPRPAGDPPTSGLSRRQVEAIERRVAALFRACPKHGEPLVETEPGDVENGPSPDDVENRLVCATCENEGNAEVESLVERLLEDL